MKTTIGSKRRALTIVISVLLIGIATAAGIGAYAVYDERSEIHALQARVRSVGEQSERATRAARGLCTALAILQQRRTSAADITSLARLTKSECTPILHYPTPR
jgi:hypothetical protein